MQFKPAVCNVQLDRLLPCTMPIVKYRIDHFHRALETDIDVKNFCCFCTGRSNLLLFTGNKLVNTSRG